MDIAPGERHGLGMPTIRLLLSAVMTIVILPWGAYVGGSMAAPPESARVAEIGFGTSEAGPTLRATDPVQVSVARTCRTATLPGSHCAPDLAFLAVGAARHGAVARDLAVAPAASSMEDLTHPPLTGPPRLV